MSQSTSYRDTVRQLASAQKGAARSAPAYSRFVNRRLGRLLAAWAYRRGLSPNAVTGLSALAGSVVDFEAAPVASLLGLAYSIVPVIYSMSALMLFIGRRPSVLWTRSWSER